ncbi:hypothetical protein B4168_1039 [Anoxybacillus flavithermus]|nr:hypothetical protein B4168_1039 [Anoxybacillus flavithermus]OAO87045.1 hypothetical protein GT23_2063 [Parageobacillus thermoglucosidasius]
MGVSLIGLIFIGIGLILFLVSILIIFLKREGRNLLKT